jgi:TatD DNase family protein
VLVDSHCHLDYLSAEQDLDALVERARAAGVGGMLTISTKLSEFDQVRAIAERYDDVWCSVGVHPHEAAAESAVTTERLLALAEHPKVVGIGETGLDYFYEHSPRPEQQASFRTHIAAARTSGLPLIVHTRDADDDTAAILEAEHAAGAFPGLIHCFTAGAGFARRALALGLYISFSGIVTFKKADDLRAVAAEVPTDRLLVETDAPYLAPDPMRGKTNEPAYVSFTAARVAELRGIAPGELAVETSDNFFRLFGKARRPAPAQVTAH